MVYIHIQGQIIRAITCEFGIIHIDEDSNLLGCVQSLLVCTLKVDLISTRNVKDNFSKLYYDEKMFQHIINTNK